MRQNSNQTKHLPTLLVQQIRLQWYKDCRGGNAAVQRNQYPRAMRLSKDFFSYYPFGLPTHFASIIQRPDRFQIDRDCRRLMEWKPNGTMRLHPFELIQKEHGIHVRYRNDVVNIIVCKQPVVPIDAFVKVLPHRQRLQPGAVLN